MKKKRRLFPVVVMLLAAVLLWLIWGSSALCVEKFQIKGRLPEAFDGFRIVQISDLHNARFGTENETLLKLLRRTAPDIIVITGDLVDARRTRRDIALDFAAKAAAIAPCYYVTGNHEAQFDHNGSFKDSLRAVGVTVLENERLQLTREGESISLIGIDDPNFTPGGASAADVRKTLEALCDGTSYQILLAHRPELFPVYAACGVDLVFSGHAHGGQIRLPLIGGLYAPGQGFFPKYDAGVYTDGAATMIVSRGLGESLFPLRINNRPELVVVELSAEPESR